MKLKATETILNEKYGFLLAVMQEMPTGVLVLGPEGVVFCNREAERFARRHGLPQELEVLPRRIFDAIKHNRLKELFPGEIVFSRRLDDSLSNWVFNIQPILNPKALVAIFIIEESLGNKTDLNALRIKYRLTRRETDVIRRVLKGLKNVDIAEEYGISEQTVKDHLSSAYGKLGMKNRVELLHAIMDSSLLR